MNNLPRSGGCVLACNHQSYLDPILVAMLVDREVHFMARTSLFKNPVFRAIIVTLNTFAIERDSSDVKGVKEAVHKLEAGNTLMVFPEGTRTKDGHLGRVKSGIAVIAQRAAVPIVPVLIHGAYRVWSRHRRFPGPGTLAVSFGKPLFLDSLQSRSEFSVVWSRALDELELPLARRG